MTSKANPGLTNGADQVSWGALCHLIAALRTALIFFAVSLCICSETMASFNTARCQTERSGTRSSQVEGLILKSLNLFFCPPRERASLFSSPYRKRFGKRSFGILTIFANDDANGLIRFNDLC